MRFRLFLTALLLFLVPTPGDYIFTGIWYRWDGTQWVPSVVEARTVPYVQP